MGIERRKFLQCAPAAGLTPAISLLLNEAVVQVGSPKKGTQNADQTAFDQSVFDFWTSNVRSPYEDFVAGVQSKGAEPPPQPKDSTFLFPSATKGLVPAGTLDTSDINNFPADGDQDVTVHVERFRASPEDQASLVNLQSGTLRIDVKQVTPLPGLPEALAWTAMATLASRDKKQTVPNLSR
jgi:hypothetical protein